MEDLQSRGVLQPMLFKCEGRYFVKLDAVAMQAADASCFADCIELLFACFWVFNVEYPHDLRPTYTFIERLFGIPGRASPIVNDLLNGIKNASNGKTFPQLPPAPLLTSSS